MIDSVGIRLIAAAVVLPLALMQPCICRAGNSSPAGIDLDGQQQPIAAGAPRAVVLIFVASDCPISNRYLPEIQRIQQSFDTQQVKFWIVYPNPAETVTGIRNQLAAYSLHVAALLDPAQQLVALAHAHTTPEAAVFVRGDVHGDHEALREVYRGRIDDRYISFGHEKPQATHHDLEDALHAALAGQQVKASEGHPVGCAIVPVALAGKQAVPKR